MEIISERFDLSEFCAKVKRWGFMKVLQAASAEIVYQRTLYEERTGHFEFPKGSRQSQYCDDLQVLIHTLTNGSFPAGCRPGLVRDLAPLMKEILKQVSFCGNVEELVSEALRSASRRTELNDIMALVEPLADSLCIVVSRQEVEAGDIQPALSTLKQLIVSPETARAYKEKVDIAFDGYDDYLAELFEIPKVRDYVHALDGQFPFWLFFLSKRHLGLQCLALCFLLPYLTDKAKAETHPKQFEELLIKRWFPAMNAIAEYAGLKEDEVEALTVRAMKYFTEGRSKETE
jgi:hypothetical protein